MKMKWFINPFERIAGWQALILGLIIMSLTAILGKINHVAFDGALDAHVGGSHSFALAFLMQFVDLLSLFLAMWLAGVCFSKSKVRAIDVAGTISLSRAPMLLLAIICFLPIAPIGLYDVPRIIIFSIISIPLTIWMIALMYHAYTVSCHIKGTRAVVSFIGALLVAEVISKCIFIFLLSSLFLSPKTGNSQSTDDILKADTVVVDLSNIHQTTEKVMKHLEQGNFDAIVAYFDDKMKKGLSASGLKMGWLQICMTYGSFEGADWENVKESTVGEYRRIEVPCAFGKNTLYLRLAFNQDGTISGMFIQP